MSTKEAKGIKIDGKDVKIPSEETLKKVIIETIQYFSKPGTSHKKRPLANVTTIKRRFNNTLTYRNRGPSSQGQGKAR